METAVVPAPQTAALDLALLKAVGLDRAAPEQRQLAIALAERYNLDLMLRHIVLIDGKPYVTRDGLLHIAHRSGVFDGISTTRPVVEEGYFWSHCVVWRKDMSHPFEYDGRYPVKGKNATFNVEMAIKVAECMALRRAFDVAAPVYEERWDLDIPHVEEAPPKTLAEKAAERVAEITNPPAPEPPPADEVWDAKRVVEQFNALMESGTPRKPKGSIVNPEEVAEGAPVVYREVTPLTIPEFAKLARDGMKTKGEIAFALGEFFNGVIPSPLEVSKIVESLNDQERGYLAVGLGLL
jgi:hypothetical protein